MGIGHLGRGSIAGLLLGLAVTSAARADEPQRAPAIWYRASQQCPSDADFMAKLAGGAVQARLAEAGDHVDFLVTLVVAGAETVGRLERQTRAGTVAIRELRDASCERVAEGLALSLGLALEPASRVAVEAPPVAAPVALASQKPAPTVMTVPVAQRPLAEPAPVAPPAKAQRRVALGAAAGVLYGLAPNPMARARAFVDFEPILPALSASLSARLGLVGARGWAATRVGSVDQWLLGGFVEGCPFRLGNARFGLRPCLDIELGASGAARRGGSSFGDSTGWVTPGAGLRASAALPYRLGLEASAGVQVPLLRSEVFAAGSSLYRAEIVLFQASLGLSFGLP